MCEESEVFKILISSDNHLGCHERNPIRANDSFRTFEEVLQAANQNDVDFILLAGDLFHVNRPSLDTISKTMSLIRKYCFGGDGAQRFGLKNFKNANCLDPNLKIKYPIFTIHGNHDDPIGMERACCLDLLSQSGLINYFGKQDQVDELLMKPIIFEKGHAKLMIFGFGSMREERLHHLIQSNKFQYMTPEDATDSLRKYFKILLVHQNRVPRPGTKHVNPYDLGDLPDFVIWGHEHDAVPEPEFFEQNKFYILQPGSTVATSLSPAENGDKYYYILTCYYDQTRNKLRFKIDPHKCETVRPVFMETIDVDSLLSRKSFRSNIEQRKFLFNTCRKQVENILGTDEDKPDEEKPLIRLRLEFQDKELLFDRRQFESQFSSSVANTNDIIRFIKKRSAHSNLYDDEDVDYGFVEVIDSIDFKVPLQKDHVITVLGEHFQSSTDEQKLSILDEQFLIEKLTQFIDKNQEDGFEDFVNNTIQAFSAILLNDPRIDLEQSLIKEEVRNIKLRIENDEKYRAKLKWISQEPYAKRPITLLKQKVLFEKNPKPTEQPIFESSENDQLPKNDDDEDDGFFNQKIDLFDLDDPDASSSKIVPKKKPPKTSGNDQNEKLDQQQGDLFEIGSDDEVVVEISNSKRRLSPETTKDDFDADFYEMEENVDKTNKKADSQSNTTFKSNRGRKKRCAPDMVEILETTSPQSSSKRGRGRGRGRGITTAARSRCAIISFEAGGESQENVDTANSPTSGNVKKINDYFCKRDNKSE